MEPATAPSRCGGRCPLANPEDLAYSSRADWPGGIDGAERPFACIARKARADDFRFQRDAGTEKACAKLLWRSASMDPPAGFRVCKRLRMGPGRLPLGEPSRTSM